jgi:phage FluMu protein gp41
VLDRPESLREIGRAAKIDVAQLSRFANELPSGKLGQDAIDRLAAYLGLELRPCRKGKGR